MATPIIKQARKKIRKNILPLFEDTRWLPYNSTKEVTKEGSQIGFIALGNYGGVNFKVPLTYAGKTVSMSVGAMKGNSPRVMLSWRIGSTWYHNVNQIVGNIIGGKKENIAIPSNVAEIVVYIQEQTAYDGYTYFKDVQLEFGAVATAFEEYHEMNTLTRFSNPKNIIQNGDNTTGSGWIVEGNGADYVSSTVTRNGRSVRQLERLTGTTSLAQRIHDKVAFGDYVLAIADINVITGSVGLGFNRYGYFYDRGSSQTITKTGWNTYYWKFQRTSIQDTMMNVVFNFANNGDKAQIDNVAVFKISKDLYDKIDVDPQYTGNYLLDKFKFVKQNESAKVIMPRTKFERGLQLSESVTPSIRINNMTGFGSNDFTINMSFNADYTKYGDWLSPMLKSGSVSIQKSGSTNKAHIRIDTATSGTGFNQTRTTTRPVYDGKWHEIALTIKDGLCEFYIDGALEFSFNYVGTLKNNDATPYDMFNGMKGAKVGFVRFYNRKLSAQEIASNFNGEVVTDSLFAEYDARYFQNVSGTVIKDLTGRQADATTVGASYLQRDMTTYHVRAVNKKDLNFTFSRNSVEKYGDMVYGRNQPRITPNGILIEEGTTNLTVQTVQGWDGAILDVTKVRSGEFKGWYKAKIVKVPNNSNFRLAKFDYVTINAGETASYAIDFYCPSGKIDLKIDGTGGGSITNKGGYHYEGSYSNPSGATSSITGSIFMRGFNGLASNLTVGDYFYYKDVIHEKKPYLTSFTVKSRPNEILTLPSDIFDTKGFDISVTLNQKSANTAGHVYALEIMHDTSNRFQFIINKSGNSPYAEFYINNTGYGTYDGTQMSLNVDHTLRAVYDGNVLQWYIDGVLKKTITVGAIASTKVPTITLGSYNGSSYCNALYKSVIFKDSTGKITYQL